MSPARKARPRRRTGWLVVLGIGLAAWVVWALATAPTGRSPRREVGRTDGGEADAAASADIGDESRAALREILREAEAEDEPDAGDGRGSR